MASASCVVTLCFLSTGSLQGNIEWGDGGKSNSLMLRSAFSCGVCDLSLGACNLQCPGLHTETMERAPPGWLALGREIHENSRHTRVPAAADAEIGAQHFRKNSSRRGPCHLQTALSDSLMQSELGGTWRSSTETRQLSNWEPQRGLTAHFCIDDGKADLHWQVARWCDCRGWESA